MMLWLDVWVCRYDCRGIVDPVKVTRSGIENAASAAGVLLTTEVAIADEPEERIRKSRTRNVISMLCLSTPSADISNIKHHSKSIPINSSPNIFAVLVSVNARYSFCFKLIKNNIWNDKIIKSISPTKSCNLTTHIRFLSRARILILSDSCECK